ncbi:MAG: hypothetical protein FWG68_00715 [Defluviitaleaceae bacterium]|nr:hypothetical protein [Defluviitaleaceae bacterium]
MFFKQLKYDLLFSRDMFLGMAALLLAAAVFMRIGDTLGVSDVPYDDMVGFVVVMLVFGVAVLIAIFGTIVQLFNFYRKSIFGNSGYFFLTLPIKKDMVLLSKVATAVIWLNFMAFVGLLAGSIIASPEVIFVNLPDMIEVADALMALLSMNVMWLFLVGLLYFTVTLANSVVGVRLNYVVGGAVSFVLFVAHSWLIYRLDLVLLELPTEGTVFSITVGATGQHPIILAVNFAAAVLVLVGCRYLLRNRVALE